MPFDCEMFGLGGWNANEPTVHAPVTALHLTGREVANGGGGHLEDIAGITITKVDARKDGQAPWRNLAGWPALSSWAKRFTAHVEVAAPT